MLPDDVFRERLEQTLVDLEAWAEETRSNADITITASDRYWRMTVFPFLAGACPFELLLNASQTFDLSLDGEIYENRPVERFDFFIRLAQAIAAGRVERIETRNSLTGLLIAIAMRVEIAPDWRWMGSRRILKHDLNLLTADEERQTRRFLPYSR